MLRKVALRKLIDVLNSLPVKNRELNSSKFREKNLKINS